MARFLICAILTAGVLLSQRTPPKITHKQEPVYSEEAREAKLQGAVLLALIVDREGIPTRIRIIRPLGLGLDEKALEAVRQWRFEPASVNGKPVEAAVNVEVNFRLDGQPKQSPRQ